VKQLTRTSFTIAVIPGGVLTFSGCHKKTAQAAATASTAGCC